MGRFIGLHGTTGNKGEDKMIESTAKELIKYLKEYLEDGSDQYAVEELEVALYEAFMRGRESQSKKQMW